MARPYCSMTYVQLTPPFSIVFGRNRSLPVLTSAMCLLTGSVAASTLVS